MSHSPHTQSQCLLLRVAATVCPWRTCNQLVNTPANIPWAGEDERNWYCPEIKSKFHSLSLLRIRKSPLPHNTHNGNTFHWFVHQFISLQMEPEGKRNKITFDQINGSTGKCRFCVLVLHSPASQRAELQRTLFHFAASAAAVVEVVAGGRLLIYDPIAPKNLFPSPHIQRHLIKCSFSSSPLFLAWPAAYYEEMGESCKARKKFRT